MSKIKLPTHCNCPNCGDRIFFTGGMVAKCDTELLYTCVKCKADMTIFQGDAELVDVEDGDDD